MKFLYWLLGSLRADEKRSHFCFKRDGSFEEAKSTKREDEVQGAAVGIMTILLICLCSSVFWVIAQTILKGLRI